MARSFRIGTDIALDVSRQAKSAGVIIWEFFKVEATPPMTVAAVNGPFGKTLEANAAKIVDSVIKGLDNQIKKMEHEAVLAIKAKEAALQAQILKQKEEAKKAEEKKKKLAAEAAKKAAEEAKKLAASKAAEAKKAEAKKAEAKKSEASKKSSGAKKPAKTPKKDKKPKK